MALGCCAEVDADLFFPEKGEGTRAAKMICRGREVRKKCSSTRSSTTSGTGFGVACLSGNAAN